jgi:hypothetical protein
MIAVLNSVNGVVQQQFAVPDSNFGGGNTNVPVLNPVNGVVLQQFAVPNPVNGDV